MVGIAIGIVVLLVGVPVFVLARRKRRRDEIERQSITPQALHDLMARNDQLVVLDVRQPLDLLAKPEIIPGAVRIPPDEIQRKPSLIPKDKETVVYCTCPDDKTSRIVIRRARDLHLTQVKFLKGGLASWKASGYPVSPYTGNFSLQPVAEH